MAAEFDSVFIVVLPTTERTLTERFDSYKEAARRIELFPREGLSGQPLIFRELPDGSQRLVRNDGKPLQWHRVPEEEDRPAGPEEPIPVSEVPPEFGPIQTITFPPAHDDDNDEPLPLAP